MAMEVRETCGCGATWEGSGVRTEEREKFREAHKTCREPDHQLLEGLVDRFEGAVRELGDHVENFGAYATKIERAESSRRNYS